MAFLRSVVLVQALFLAIKHAVAKPIPLITRHTIEDEYDFVICGGPCRVGPSWDYYMSLLTWY